MTSRTAHTLLASAALFSLTSMLSAADVGENWTRLCARCHAADGSGNTKAGQKLKVKDYTSAEVQAKMTDEEMLKAILEGAKDENGKERMQSYKEKLTEQEAKDLVAHVRSMKK
jgi:cytochrome c6